MASDQTENDHTPEEIERRARQIAHRLLTTPWRPRLTKKQEAERDAQAKKDSPEYRHDRKEE